jgi:hypothetical protein
MKRKTQQKNQKPDPKANKKSEKSKSKKSLSTDDQEERNLTTMEGK